MQTDERQIQVKLFVNGLESLDIEEIEMTLVKSGETLSGTWKPVNDENPGLPEIKGSLFDTVVSRLTRQAQEHYAQECGLYMTVSKWNVVR